MAYKRAFKKYREESINFMTPKLVEVIEIERERAPDIVIELSKGKTLDFESDFYGVSLFYALEKKGETVFERDDDLIDRSKPFKTEDGARNYISQQKQELKAI